jgi:pimeloyl-ACP methyl ester carboxylesterase
MPTVELACSDKGEGPPLVILHGLLGAKRNWATVAKGLAAGQRVICADLRNHGASPWADAHAYPDMARPPLSPAPIRVLTVSGAAGAKAIAWQPAAGLNGRPERDSRPAARRRNHGGTSALS